MKSSFKDSRKSLNNYFLWRVERSYPIVERVNKIRRIKNLQILDLGCGYGALSKVLGEYGAQVTAAEVDQESLIIAKKFLQSNKNINVVKIPHEKLPFKNNTFDIVFLLDVIEHVKNPKKTIEESLRILKNNGLLIIQFTPYYSFTGHHLYRYTKLPIQFLPKPLAKKIVYSRKIGNSMRTHDQIWELYSTLNKLRISQFQEMTKKLQKIEEKFIIKYPDVFEINLPVINLLGPAKDFFTMSYEAVYQKSS